MKLNKIISLALACLMIIGCSVTASAATPTGTTTSYVVASGNGKVATFTNDGTGTFVAKSVLNGYANANNTQFCYGSGYDKDSVELTLDSATGKFSLDKILRFSSTIDVTLKPTSFNFGTFFYTGKTLVYPKSFVVPSASRPAAGSKINIDSVVDLNTLTSYFYINNVYVGEHSYTPAAGTAALRFSNAIVYFGNSDVTTADVEMLKVSNITKTEYPAGTALADVQNAVTGTPAKFITPPSPSVITTK